MKKIKLFLSLAIITTFSINTYAQVDLSEPDRIHCGSAVINNLRLDNNPLIQDIINQQNINAKQFEKNHVSNKSGIISYTIPVVYHIIHNYGSENVSKATIEASIQNLNDDFQKLNSDISQVVAAFTGIAADVEVQFRLAHLDPSGNCTEGITRTVSELTYDAGENVKSLVNWNTTKYLNIWVVNTLSSGAGGYSYYPGYAPSQSSEGVVIRSAQLGNSVTHEVGHYLNLPHCWGSSNTPADPGNCTLDDGISDTPNTIGNTTCNTSAITCGSLDNVQNYMEYSFCERMFTEGQKSRMHAALNSGWGSRNTLWTPSNLTATGTATPYGTVTCAPTAEFTYNKEYICEGGTVTYTDQSWGSDATAWNWSFNGGSPSTGNTVSPTITYNTAGVYSTTLTASNSGGSSSPETLTNIITVSSLTAAYAGPIIEGFENTTQFNNDWRIENPTGGQAWTNNNVAAATGSRSIRLRNYQTTTNGEIDDFISPSYDISSISSPTLKFKVAYKRKNSSSSDNLFVYYSIDCGATWTFTNVLLGATTMSTSPDQSSIFTPSNSSHWLEKTVNLSSISSATNVRFRFRFTSGGGNDVYIDDINIDNAVGLNEMSNIGSFNVYPNPTSSSAQISFNLVKTVDNLTIRVRNAVGQEVTRVINGQSFIAGKYTLKIDEERKLSKGIYFIEFTADDVVQVQKLIVQ